MQRPLTLSLLLVTLCAAPVLAHGKLSFQELDHNHDHKISLLEMKTQAVGRFAKADKNQDGVITVEEVLNLMPFFVRGQARPKVTEFLNIRDLNHNGQVTLQEIQAFAVARFKKNDRNGDGLIDPAEFKAGWADQR